MPLSMKNFLYDFFLEKGVEAFNNVWKYSDLASFQTPKIPKTVVRQSWRFPCFDSLPIVTMILGEAFHNFLWLASTPYLPLLLSLAASLCNYRGSGYGVVERSF